MSTAGSLLCVRRAAFTVLLAGCAGGTAEPRDDGTRTITVLTGAGVQSATVLTAVPVIPTVRVTNSRGEPVMGATVVFSVTAGGGTLALPVAPTDADGVASCLGWTLGSTAGTQSLSARVSLAANPMTVTFQATALPGSVATVTLDRTLVLLSIGDTARLLATAHDAHGNVVDVAARLAFASDSASVVAVGTTGVMTAVATGSTRVRATVDGVSHDARVSVGSPAPVITTSEVTLPGTGNGVTILDATNALVGVAGGIQRVDPSTGTLGAFMDGLSGPFDLTAVTQLQHAFAVDSVVPRIRIVSLVSDTVVHTLPIRSPFRVRTSVDSAMIYATADNRSFVRINAATYATDSVPLTNGVFEFALSRDGSRAFVGSFYGTIFEVDLATMAIVRQRTLQMNIESVAVSPDRRRLFLGGGWSVIRVLDATTLEDITSIPDSDWAQDMAVTPDGRYLFASRLTTGVQVFDAHNFALHHTVSLNSPERIALSSSGDVLLVTQRLASRLFIVRRQLPAP